MQKSLLLALNEFIGNQYPPFHPLACDTEAMTHAGPLDSGVEGVSDVW